MGKNQCKNSRNRTQNEQRTVMHVAKNIRQNEQKTSGQAAQNSRKNDPVNHPSHYTQGGIECIDAIHAAVSRLSGNDAWLTGSCIKYLWRWRLKNGLEDLKKAKFYLDRLIEQEEARIASEKCAKIRNSESLVRLFEKLDELERVDIQTD